jgi:hypothetical protein
MAKKYSRDEVIKHAKALGMPVPPNAATMSKSDYKDFTNNLNTFKAEEKHKTEPAKKEAKKYRDTTEGKNYVAKAKEVKKRAEAGGDTSGEYSIDDLPSSVIREIDKEIPLEAFDYTEGLLSQISQASPFVTGARSGGRMDYTTYGGSVKDNTDYVNTYPDLKRAWQEILNNPNSETARYWLPRMGVTDPADITIDRFGMAHQAENAKLGSDTYIGDTEVRPDGSRWDEWREGKDESGQRDPNSDYWKRSILDPDTGKPAVSTVDQEKAKANAAAARAASNAARMAGGSGEYLATPYTRPALQDWSDLAPPNMPGLLGSAKAQQDLLGSGLAAYQPWAQGGVIDYVPRGGSTWAPRTYSTNPLDNSAAVVNNQQNNQQQSGTFMGQNYANQGENMMLLDTHNKAMQLIRGGHNQGMGIGELMGKAGLVNTLYTNLGGTDAIVGGGSFGNYTAPPGETAPLYYGDATANPHLTNTYDTSRTGTMNIFQGGQDYDAPLIFDPTATAEYTGGLL